MRCITHTGLESEKKLYRCCCPTAPAAVGVYFRDTFAALSCQFPQVLVGLVFSLFFLPAAEESPYG